jgi:hypothetical protein
LAFWLISIHFCMFSFLYVSNPLGTFYNLIIDTFYISKYVRGKGIEGLWRGFGMNYPTKHANRNEDLFPNKT